MVFKKRIKKIFKKRKFMRKRFKRFKYKKGTGKKIYSSPFGNKMKLKMFSRCPPFASLKGSIHTSAFTYIRVSSHKPWGAAGYSDLQSQYWDQIAPVYKNYRVTGIKYKIKVILPPAALADDTVQRGVVVVVGGVKNTANIFNPTAPEMITLDNMYKAGSNPGNQLKVINFHPDRSNSATFQGYIDMGKIFGRASLYDKDYQAVIVGTPVNEAYLNIHWRPFASTDETNPITVTIEAQITQYVRFIERNSATYDT